MEQFLEVMRSITEGVLGMERRTPTSNKDVQHRDATCRNCGKRGHTHNDCRSQEVLCFCKIKGHRSYECPRLDRGGRRAAPATSGYGVTGTSATGRTVAMVQNEDKLIVANVCVCVENIQGVTCQLRAIIDTGSAISLLHYDVYDARERLQSATVNYNTINGSRVPILGRLRVAFVLREIPSRVLNLDFHVVPSGGFGADLILGWDLINKERLTVVVRPDDDACVADASAAPFVLFHDELFEEPDSLKCKIEEANIDFDETVKRRLIQTIIEARCSIVPVTNDDYAVSVNLKDESTFAYAPRCLAFAERRQIREITDDLLSRGIIKESTSPYCARIVPVRKKNGSMRLCIDLHPLNARVIKQKYLFPLIEDCLARLDGRFVFTLLDLRDGFTRSEFRPIVQNISRSLPLMDSLNLTSCPSVIRRRRLSSKKELSTYCSL